MVTLGGRLSKVTGTLTGSVLVTAIGCFMQWIGVGEHLNFTIIGSIMPLIPGAGVYWTIHYLVANDLSMALQTGFTAVKMAIAIVFGIVLAFELPQKLFTPQKK